MTSIGDLSPTTSRLIKAARTHGVHYPWQAWKAHKAAGVPYYVVCAFLMQETDGGNNVYGHDVDAAGHPQPFWGAGEVTPENYAIYKQQRDLGVTHTQFSSVGRRCQGVGPMQLTYWSIQDDADAIGGCWDPGTNILAGTRVLAGSFAIHGNWHDVARAWNGSEAYAAQMDDRLHTWSAITGGL